MRGLNSTIGSPDNQSLGQGVLVARSKVWTAYLPTPANVHTDD